MSLRAKIVVCGSLLVCLLGNSANAGGWPFGKKKEAPYALELDSNIADAIALSCQRRDTSLECIISNKMPVRASLRPLEFVCYLGNVKVRSVNIYEDIDAGGKLKYTMYCFDDFDRAVLRQQRRSY